MCDAIVIKPKYIFVVSSCCLVTVGLFVPIDFTLDVALSFVEDSLLQLLISRICLEFPEILSYMFVQYIKARNF